LQLLGIGLAIIVAVDQLRWVLIPNVVAAELI
jgi:hypothetical protein